MTTPYEIPLQRRARRRGKSRRWKFITLGVLAATVLVWHLVPAWRKHVLESALDELQKYRDAHGRYPMSQAELDEVLDERALTRRGCYVKYDLGPNWSTYTAIYRPYDDGRSFTLSFNHDCFCDFPDTSRYEADGDSAGQPNGWDEWCD